MFSSFGPAVSIESVNLDRTRTMLGGDGVAYHECLDRLLVPPSDALDAWINFHRPGAPPLWAGAAAL